MTTKSTALQLQGVYNSLYYAITHPDQKFVISRYFLDEWLPLLGPTQAWLIIALRQRCFWNQRQDWCVVDKATLAAETAIRERTIERHLKKMFVRWFVLAVNHRYQYRRDLGKKVRDKNRYHLLLNEPLSPRHQVGLLTSIRELKTQIDEAEGTNETTSTIDHALAITQHLIELPHLIDKISGIQPDLKQTTPQTIWQLLETGLELTFSDYAGDKRLNALDHRCTQLYNRIVQPNKVHVGWQYFRLQWVPLLGHALAWIIIVMRRHCYWDQTSGELRDEYTFFKKELAQAIGQTPRNLANLWQNPYSDLFFTAVEKTEADDERSNTRSSAKSSQAIQYRIRMTDEPLTPADQTHIAETLQQQLQNTPYGEDPESGQLNIFPILQAAPNRQNFAYGQTGVKEANASISETESLSPSKAKKSRLDATTPEKMSERGPQKSRMDADLQENLSLRSAEMATQVNPVTESLSGRLLKKSRIDKNRPEEKSPRLTQKSRAGKHQPEKESARSRKKSPVDKQKLENMSDIWPPKSGKNVATIKRLLQDSRGGEGQEEEDKAIVAPPAQHSLKILLNRLGVQEPTRSKLLSMPQLTSVHVQAWVLYAEAQSRLADPLSYAVKRLLAGDAPPAAFVTLAQLDEATWSLFDQIATRLRLGDVAGLTLPPHQEAAFSTWLNVYTDFDSAAVAQFLGQLAARRQHHSVDVATAITPKVPTLPDETALYAQQLWRETLDQLQYQMTQATFNAWLKQSQGLMCEAGILWVGVCNQHAKTWLEKRLIRQIEPTLASIADEHLQLKFKVMD